MKLNLPDVINNSDFVLNEIPNFHPISQHYERLNWWREQKRLCIEGKWCNGIWMPGVLYFYINFWTILVGGSGNAGKKLSRPWLRDLEWDKAYVAVEARGFSGFANDPEYTCNELLKPDVLSRLREDNLLDIYLNSGIIREEDLDKKYMHPRFYLRRKFNENYGKPLFQNEANNVVDLECREGGKSYWASAQIGHNFLFDGAYDYDLYMEAKLNGSYLTSDTLVGAIHTKYSSDLLSKFKLGFDNLPGKIEYRGITYHSPFLVETEGSLLAGKTFRSLEGDSVKSKIHHVTFKDNPLAGNGIRVSLAMLEEVGFMDNIDEVLGSMKESVSQSGRQFGTIYMFGTGGLSKGIALNYMKTIFYNPKEYNCLEFDDIYENKGKIGYFVPKHFGLNQFKEGPNKITNYEKADKFLSENFKKLNDNKLKQAIELINNPRVPSQMFYTVDGMFFPTIDLKERLGDLETNKIELDETSKGFVIINKDGKYEFKHTSDKPIRSYPHKVNHNSQGCVEIFEFPVKNINDEIPSGIYIAGCDPVDDDDINGSLQSTFIINKLTRRIVAEYTARHQTAKEYWENLRRLLVFYNAKCNYENTKKGLSQYFENMNCSYLLSETPKILKDQSIISKSKLVGNKALGTPATLAVNKWARELINDWLLEPSFNDENKLNLYNIKSVALLEELISWNTEANFDRISALGMAMIYLEDKLKIVIDIDRKITTQSDNINNFLKTKINDNSFKNISRTEKKFQF